MSLNEDFTGQNFEKQFSYELDSLELHSCFLHFFHGLYLYILFLKKCNPCTVWICFLKSPFCEYCFLHRLQLNLIPWCTASICLFSELTWGNSLPHRWQLSLTPSCTDWMCLCRFVWKEKHLLHSLQEYLTSLCFALKCSNYSYLYISDHIFYKYIYPHYVWI